MNKIALITGASAGIGMACAYTFAEAGYKLILLARRSEKLEILSNDLKTQYGTESIIFECDVRSRARVQEVINSIPYDWKNIDVLINNAGLARGLEKFQDGVNENWEEMIDTNVKGLIYISREVIPLMIARKTGTVVNIASIAGIQFYPGGNVYSASKAAVKTLSKGMTIDLNGTGVRVCNIDPGLVETEFSIVRFRGNQDKADLVYKGYEPLEGKDIADIALFACSLPQRVNIQDILVTPLAQATATIVDKKINN